MIGWSSKWMIKLISLISIIESLHNYKSLLKNSINSDLKLLINEVFLLKDIETLKNQMKILKKD